MIRAEPNFAKTARCIAVIAVLVASIEPVASAQDSRTQPSRSSECLPRATRVGESCDPKQVVVRIEQELDFSIKVPAAKDLQCSATIEIAYTQRDTAVGVEGTIANSVCGASNGDYKLLVSVRDANGLRTLEFSESWQRQDGEPVKFSAAYPIGENVDLLRVRPAQSRCTCADLASE